MTIHQRASFDVEAAGLNATSKTNPALAKMVSAWENKIAKRAMQGSGLALMAMSLTACGGGSSTTTAATTTTTTTTTTTVATSNAAVALTAGPDTLTGDSNNDTFNALVDGHLEAGDTITGGAGTNDKLVIRDYDTSAGTFTMTGVEVININFATTAQTLDLTDVTGVTSLIVDSGVVLNTVSNVAATTSLTLANISAGVTNIDITFADGAFDPATNSYSLTLDDVDDALTLSLDSFGAAVEAIDTLNIATGSNDNAGVITFDVEGAAAAAVVVTGSANASLAGFTSASVDASDMTGNLTINMAAAASTVTGGAGDDTIDMNAGLTFADTIVGGLGADTLKITAGGTIALSNTALSGQMANVSGIETLNIDDEITADTTIDMSKLAGLKNIDFDDFADGGDDQLIINKLLDGAKVTIDGNAGTAADANSDLELNFAANSAVNDVTLVLEGLTMGILANTDGYIDTATINSITATNLVSVISGFTVSTLTVTGSAALDINGSALSTSTTTVEASTLTGDLDVTASTSATTINAGSGADLIVGGSGADVISAGAGIDSVDGGTGNNTITLGGGADVLILGNGVDTIKDFVVGAANDDIHLDLSGLNAAPIVNLHMWDTTDVITAADTVSDSTITITGAYDLGSAGTDTVLLILNGTFANAAAVETAVEVNGTFQLTSDATYANDDAMLMMWDDGSNSYLSTLMINTAGNWTANGTIDAADSTVAIVATFEGIADCTTILAAQFADIIT